ncbi:MAG: PQQ-binding-like beta-propeller repeat protein [Acidobacteriota bacterium]
MRRIVTSVALLLAPFAAIGQTIGGNQTGGGKDPGGQSFGGSGAPGRDRDDGPDLFIDPFRFIRDDEETWDQRFVTDKLWKQTLPGRPASGPVRSGDFVVVPFEGRKLAAFHFGDGADAWSVEMPGDLAGSLVLSSEKDGGSSDVFFTTLQGDAVRVRASDGGTAFRAHLSQEIRREPFVIGDLVIVSSRDDFVFALSAKDGTIRWKGTTGGKGLTTPTAMHDRVVVGDEAGVVHALSLQDGRESWTYQTGAGIVAPAALTENRVLVASGDRKVYCLDLDDGDRNWSHRLGSTAAAPPLLHDKFVYVATHDDLLSALRLKNGFRKWKAKLPRRVIAPLTAEGDVVYVTPFAGRDVLAFMAKNGYPMGTLSLKTHDDYGIGRAEVSETAILYATNGRTLQRFKKITSKQVETGEEKLPVEEEDEDEDSGSGTSPGMKPAPANPGQLAPPGK